MAEPTYTVKWTVATLAAQLRGEVNVDDNAAGGTVPTRLTDIVRKAGATLWNAAPWRFQIKTATLTIGLSATTGDMPANFRELVSVQTHEATDGTLLEWTDSQAEFDAAVAGAQKCSDDYLPENPVWGTWIVDSTGISLPLAYHYIVWPAPSDATCSYPIAYVEVSPWEKSTGKPADSENPLWPAWMDEGWELLARAQCMRGFKSGDGWAAHMGLYNNWLADKLRKNLAYRSLQRRSAFDGYGDSLRTASMEFVADYGMDLGT